MIINEPEGYRRTGVKTSDENKLKQKIEEFEARGEKVKVVVVGGKSIIYLKKEKPL